MLRGRTFGWTEHQLSRTYPLTNDGAEDLEDDRAILEAHGYEVASQGEVGTYRTVTFERRSEPPRRSTASAGAVAQGQPVPPPALATPQQLALWRTDVQNGARLVVYPVCVSVVVLTFTRLSGVIVIRPGQSRRLRALPYVVISLVAGWWGFPAGPIRTVWAVQRALRGGIDVTDAIFAGLQPSPVLDSQESAAAAWWHDRPGWQRLAIFGAVAATAVVVVLIVYYALAAAGAFR